MEFERRYEDVVLDLPAGDSAVMDAALAVSDRVVVPVRASTFDMRTLGHLDQSIAEAKLDNGDMEAWVVLNAAWTNPRIRELEVARKQLGMLDSMCSDSDLIVRERIVYQRAIARGLTVMEYTPVDERASLEMAALYSVVFGEEYRYGR